MSTLALFKSQNNPRVIPGFGITMGFSLFYMSVIVLIPLAALFFKTFELSWGEFFDVIRDERTLAAFKISFLTSFGAALVNVVMGLLLAWVLVRYRFPGRKILDAVIDIPFALPTAVAGIALTTLYAPNGWIGQYLSPMGIDVAFTPIGIWVALIFIGLPFVVRTVQPVLEDIDKEVEEASACLGAGRRQTFIRVLLPQIFPALLTGFAMAFARALGEYGSVIFIAGNMPYVSEIVPLLIVIKLEQYQYAQATSIALVMLLLSFVLLFAINWLQRWSRKKQEK